MKQIEAFVVRSESLLCNNCTGNLGSRASTPKANADLMYE